MSHILVVGAGPTGLVFTLALLQRGIPVRLIDEKEGPSIYSKAFGIHARTLEIFAKMGVVSAFLEKGAKTNSISFHEKGKQRVLKLTHLHDTPYPFILMLPQSETEKILIEEIVKLGGKVEWKTKLVGFTEKNAQLSDGTRFSYDWLIGCDGGKSTVRHLLQLPFVGVELSETFLIVDVQGKIQAKSPSPHFFFSKEGLVGMIALNPSLIRLIFPLTGDERIENDPIALQKVLKQRGCGDFLIPEHVKWFSYFKIHRRMVNRLRQGNCFLAGDAAHIHSPAGGQGMNTSIQDAFNLAWKLSLVVKGMAQDKLLDSYEMERLPVAKKVLQGTTLFTKFLQFVQKTGFFFLFFFVLFFIKNPLKKIVSRSLTELSLRYKKNPFVQTHTRDLFWQGPKSGERAPNVQLENGRDFFEYLNVPHPILVVFQENLALTGDEYELLVLPDRNLMHAYKANKNTAYFIRPDGVIGYRSRRVRVSEVKKYLHNLFNVNPSPF